MFFCFVLRIYLHAVVFSIHVMFMCVCVSAALCYAVLMFVAGCNVFFVDLFK